MGFFGKGSLSRSEPNWLEQEKKRRGLMGGNTVEEATRKRRAERRQLKLERARHEKLAVEERLKAEAAARESGSVDGLSIDGAAEAAAISVERFSVKRAMEARYLERRQQAIQNKNNSESADSLQTTNGSSGHFSPAVEKKEIISNSTATLQSIEDDLDLDTLENEEHLQLSTEEAFFLVYALGALRVVDRDNNVSIPTPSLFSLLRHHSYYPARHDSSSLEADDPFMISYVVYHHFRSLGWVVRSGVKFGTDYLLYNRGPVFSHAEFAVIIIPSYSDPYWSETEERREYAANKQARSWWWLHCVNRVQAQVKKSLVICYVEVPPPDDSSEDIGAELGRYRVREFMLRRWVPNRTRD
jgi:tRNA-splicing endonuclease subunit Sen2